DVESLLRPEGVPPRARAQLDPVLEPGLRAVDARHLERLGRGIRRHDARERALARERERDRAGSGADVERLERALLSLRGPAADPLEHGPDEDLRFRTRDEDPRVHDQVELAEGLAAEDVL